MVQNYLVRRVREVETLANEKRAALKTKADAEKYVQSVREKIRTCFGPEPKRTPLKPRITGVVERGAFKIENVIFESRPGMLVTANLYVPKGREFPLPGVVGTCGHSSNGKAYEGYQAFCSGHPCTARLCRVDLRPDRSGRAASVRQGGSQKPDRCRCPRTPLRWQPTNARGRILRIMASLGWRASPRLSADTSGS